MAQHDVSEEINRVLAHAFHGSSVLAKIGVLGAASIGQQTQQHSDITTGCKQRWAELFETLEAELAED